jgi:hypothetical protein
MNLDIDNTQRDNIVNRDKLDRERHVPRQYKQRNDTSYQRSKGEALALR